MTLRSNRARSPHIHGGCDIGAKSNLVIFGVVLLSRHGAAAFLFFKIPDNMKTRTLTLAALCTAAALAAAGAALGGTAGTVATGAALALSPLLALLCRKAENQENRKP